MEVELTAALRPKQTPHFQVGSRRLGAKTVAILVVVTLCGLWWLIPSLLQGGLHPDTWQMTFWGREFELGYQKQPPFSSWVSALLTAEGIKLHISPILVLLFLGQMCTAVSATYVWSTIRLFYDEESALLGVLVFLGSPLTTVYANQVNQGVVLMPLYAATLFYVLRYFEHGRLADALVIGFSAGLAVITKYAVAPMLIILVYLALKTPAYRVRICNMRTLAGAAIFVLMVLPHAYWMKAHGWPMARALTDHAYRREGIVESVTNLGISLLLLFALIILIRPLPLKRLFWTGDSENAILTLKQEAKPRSPENVLRWVALGAPALMFVASLLTLQVNKPLWVVPFAPAGAAWIGVALGREHERTERRLWRVWLFPLLSLAGILALGGFFAWSAWRPDPSPAVTDTGRAGRDMQAFWRSKTNRPLHYVFTDDFGPASVIPLWSPDLPRIVVSATTAPEIAGEVRPTAESQAELIQTGGIALLSNQAAAQQPIAGLCATDVRPLRLYTMNAGRPFYSALMLAYLPPRHTAAESCPTAQPAR